MRYATGVRQYSHPTHFLKWSLQKFSLRDCSNVSADAWKSLTQDNLQNDWKSISRHRCQWRSGRRSEWNCGFFTNIPGFENCDKDAVFNITIVVKHGSNPGFQILKENEILLRKNTGSWNRRERWRQRNNKKWPKQCRSFYYIGNSSVLVRTTLRHYCFQFLIFSYFSIRSTIWKSRLTEVFLVPISSDNRRFTAFWKWPNISSEKNVTFSKVTKRAAHTIQELWLLGKKI